MSRTGSSAASAKVNDLETLDTLLIIHDELDLKPGP